MVTYFVKNTKSIYIFRTLINELIISHRYVHFLFILMELYAIFVFIYLNSQKFFPKVENVAKSLITTYSRHWNTKNYPYNFQTIFLFGYK